MKVIRKTGWHIVVEPKRLGDFGSVSICDKFGGLTDEQIERDYRDRCEEIASEIKRHVKNVGWINVEHDTDVKCSLCGREWEESLDDSVPDCPKGSPLCCEAAIKEWEETA